MQKPSPLPPQFVKPQYGSRCFADLPPTIKYLLTGTGTPSLSTDVLRGLAKKYDTVIFFFIDAFGWRFVEQYRERSPFLQELAQSGVVAQITSQFPSTTAAHATCIHTGLPVGQSGVFEWHYYEPQLDALITPLLFSFAGTRESDTLKPTGIDPKKLYPNRTTYQDLREHGVDSFVFQPREIATSTYSNVMCQGAQVRGYKTLPEALVNLQRLVTRQKSPTYFFLYFDRIDAIGHEYGPNSLQLEAEIDTFLMTMDRWFLQKLNGQLKNALFMMTADHGQVQVNPKTTIYLNLDRQFSGVYQFLKTNRRGDLLVAGGACRDFFLYIKDECLDEAHQFLADRLQGHAEVYRVQDLIEKGFFGAPPLSSNFLGRVGNLLILPFENEAVWWYEQGKFEQKYHGHHGGLTRHEMAIPLCLYEFSG